MSRSSANSEERTKRLAAALRANLRKRKDQARRRAAEEPQSREPHADDEDQRS